MKLATLLAAYNLIEYANNKSAYVGRGGDHYIEVDLVRRALCEELGLNFDTVSTKAFKLAIAKARGDV